MPARDMYYFSGYKEPHSVLLIFKDQQTDSPGNNYSEILFVQKRNPQAEQWTGKRLGAEGARENWASACPSMVKIFKNFNIDFTRFDKIIFDRFPVDIPDGRDKADLFDLVQQFKQKAGIPEDYSKDKRFDNRSYRDMTAKLREIKTPEEKILSVKQWRYPARVRMK